MVVHGLKKLQSLTLLQVLDHKIAFLKEQSFREARGAADVKDVLEKLKVKGAFMYPTPKTFTIWQWVTDEFNPPSRGGW